MVEKKTYRVKFLTHAGIYQAGDVAGWNNRETAMKFVRGGAAVPQNFDAPGYNLADAEGKTAAEAKAKPLSRMKKAELLAFGEEMALDLSTNLTKAQLIEILEAELVRRGGDEGDE